MCLTANKYPDIWQFNNECRSPKNIPTWVSGPDKIKEFVQIFYRPEYFHKLIFWKYPWYAGSRYFIKDHGDYHIMSSLEQAEKYRHAIEDQALSGHMSLYFIPKLSDEFLKKVLESGHYGQFEQIAIGRKDMYDPLDWKRGQDAAFLKSEVFSDYKKIFTFSHDAEYLFEIFCNS